MAIPTEIQDLLDDLEGEDTTGLIFGEPSEDLVELGMQRIWNVDAVSNGRLIRAWYVEAGDGDGGKFTLEAFPVGDLVKIEESHGSGSVTWNDPVEGTVEMPIPAETARALLRAAH